ncbi:uncharacterized protein LOC141630415 [Silene latifolia]|uniref:uncharacterized protein LOC141630415 n=1 Tax=Silene latifolia TaxID=37657 RepID=UPI003D786E92
MARRKKTKKKEEREIKYHWRGSSGCALMKFKPEFRRRYDGCDLIIKDEPWNKVVKSQEGMDLFNCEESAKGDVVTIFDEDVEDKNTYWKYTLMGTSYRKGWYSFRFNSEEDLNTVLKGGLWNMGAHTLILKQWAPIFDQEMDSITTVPIQILFPNLDPLLWSSDALSRLTSKIGKPLFADLTTTCKAKLSFARVMVEVDISKPLPTEILFTTPYHDIIFQKITYE